MTLSSSNMHTHNSHTPTLIQAARVSTCLLARPAKVAIYSSSRSNIGSRCINGPRSPRGSSHRLLQLHASISSKNNEFNAVVQYASTYFRERLYFKWRTHLTKVLHDRYFGPSAAYYRQQHLLHDALTDPHDRIVGDVMEYT
eukprot:SAG11_NODE_76_length_18005_cov_6.523958_10_plen_142_part_00